jgi:DNA-directed RNA polymerase subunit RPC12/RpoP
MSYDCPRCGAETEALAASVRRCRDCGEEVVEGVTGRVARLRAAMRYGWSR